MPSVQLTVRDETTAGELLGELELQLTSENIDVAELIRARVHQEVRAHNAAPRTPFAGLVVPTDQEARLREPATQRRIDPERQTEVAHEAFRRGHILVLVDDRQVTDLGERVALPAGSRVTFLKLVPLVGG